MIHHNVSIDDIMSHSWIGYVCTNNNFLGSLENHLRTYQTLTENDVIGVEYDNFMYEFDVIAVQPQKAVSILDSDVSVDILEPLELQKIFHTEVNFGETKPFNLKKGEYAYFQGKIRILQRLFP
jgi:hypothetical protein